MAEILIIEDDLRLRSEMQKHLERRGHGVHGLGDGREVLEALQQMGFDAVILDVRLPGLSGTDFLQTVARNLPCHPPLIIITGHGDKETAIKAVHFGAFDFLEKPFTPQALDESLERALMEKRQDAIQYRAQLATQSRGELTQRESEVATLAAEGLSNEEIAGRLEMGPETVKSHLKKIFRKLGVANRTALASRWKQET